jgi:hypothetical protein
VSVRSDVLLWAQRIIAKGTTAKPHELLEVKKDAGLEEAQEAFHKIARKAHPDLHRASLTPEELEQITVAYAKVAGAYQDFRSQSMGTRNVRPLGRSPTPAEIEKITVPGPPGEMSSKALVYYRKAELALRRGDLQGALLQLKMAIAADPQSQLLRKALAEVQAEVGKKP